MKLDNRQVIASLSDHRREARRRERLARLRRKAGNVAALVLSGLGWALMALTMWSILRTVWP